MLTHTLLEVCITLAFSAVLVCLSMCIPNKAVSAVTGLLLTIILLGSALTISMRLSAPEYTEAFAYTDEASGKLIKVDRERNDQYLTGTKRKIYTFLYDFLPTCQFYEIVLVSNTPITLSCRDKDLCLLADTLNQSLEQMHGQMNAAYEAGRLVIRRQI